MREIKFRVLDKITNTMCPVWGIHFKGLDDPMTINYITIEIDGTEDRIETEVELMQYTGLKDKSGKEIYEGDIVEFFPCPESEEEQHFIIGLITYRKEYAAFSARSKGMHYYLLDENSTKIIGNIHENPELSYYFIYMKENK